MSEVISDFRARSPAQQGLIAGVLAVALILVGIAERDLAHRPAQQLRGPKLVWRILATNALGALAYLRWGRRAGAAR